VPKNKAANKNLITSFFIIQMGLKFN